MTTASKTAYASSKPRAAAFIVYINGIEVPAKSVSLRYGVWQMPEMQIDMVADPVLARLGAEDRVQVTVFYLDDINVSPEVAPAYRLFGEGEITGWGYRNTSGGRVISFTVVAQIAIFTQLFVQFLTTLDDMVGHATGAADVTGFANPTDQLVYPFSLFVQGVIPGQGQDASTITRPFDFLYNVVRNMIGAQVPEAQRTIPAANFFARWSRLTNFHNRFAAQPFFDEIVDNANVFPVLRAVQNVSAVDVISKNLMPQVQNAGSLWDMIQLVFATMLMEVSMIPSMPLVTVDLASSLVQQTNFAEHTLSSANGLWTSTVRSESRKTKPKRIPSYFAKPQMLFSVPPACNAIFPSQLKTLAYQENYATQPTRLYFNDETLTRILKIPTSGLSTTIHNALSTGYPYEADLGNKLHDQYPKFNGKNFLLYAEEFFKGPVMDRRDVPPWLYFLGQAEFTKGNGTSRTADGGVAAPPAPAQTAATPAPAAPAAATAGTGTMVTTGRVGQVSADGRRVYSQRVELQRSRALAAQANFGVPADLLLAWLSHESDGKIEQVTSLNERGFFQIMGPHVSGGVAKTLKDVEAGAVLNLTLADTGKDQNDTLAKLSRDADFSFAQGVRLVQAYRGYANAVAREKNLAWSEGDLWRITKFMHNAPALMRGIIDQATTALGHVPTSWEEMHQATASSLSAFAAKCVSNATAVGGVVAGATGQMTTASDPTPRRAPVAQAAPATGAAASTVTPSIGPTRPTVSFDTLDEIQRNNLTVYQLYAKYEYFRERYAQRSGSATIAWNPYVVPGFPAAIFDQRATRVDLVCYVTTVQQSMSHEGQRGTTLSFLYGRSFQEMFDLLREEFDGGETAAGCSPAEPIRDVRKIVQSFDQAETYYQRLFFGAQRLYGKDAAFDFRKIVGYAPQTDADAPEPIFIDGPDEATQDTLLAATGLAAALGPVREANAALLVQLDGRVATLYAEISNLLDVSQDQLEFIQQDDPTYDPAVAVQQRQLEIAQLDKQRAALRASNVSIDQRISNALSDIQNSQNTSGLTRVRHNLVGDRELVPMPAAQALFDSNEAAMCYSWRPICTLDEYIIFYDAAGEGAIPAFNHRNSTGAHYYERIRRLSAPGADFVPPKSATEATNIIGIDQPNVDGLTNTNFPQTRAKWDEALLAYRNNVLSVKAPRT